MDARQQKLASGAVVVSGALIAILGGCGGATEPAATSTVTATSKVTVTAAPTSPSTTTRVETVPAVGAPAISWVMPNEIGKDLQRAQDDLQALTGNPMFVSASEDATGKGRQQVVDRNWQVCSSSPPPGATFMSETNVVFGVVRDSEVCP